MCRPGVGSTHLPFKRRREGAEAKGVLRPARTHFALLRALAAIALTLGLGWTLFLAPPAVAATPTPIVINVDDPVGDAEYDDEVESGADLARVELTQDRAAKVVRGKVTFAGTDLDPSKRHGLRIGLGIVNGNGCTVWNSFGVVHIRHELGTDTANYIVGAMTEVKQDFGVTRDGATVSFETPVGPFDGYGYRCIVVTTERLYEDGADAKYPEDSVIAFAADDPPAPPAAVVDPGKGVPAPIIDGDGDGVHDGIDKCPTVPGAASTGCETLPLAKSIKLGTKRVVIDRLLATSAGTCPAAVKVVVKLSGKTYGKSNVGTLKKGRYCHVQAVLTLKKKIKKARVTITGVGVVSVGATVAK